MAKLPGKLFFAWELNHHNQYLSNHALLRVMLEAVEEEGLSPDFRERFSARVVGSKLLPPNKRADSGRSDLLRDYQQLLKEWGFIRGKSPNSRQRQSNAPRSRTGSSSDGYRLSPLGEMLLRTSPEVAIRLAVFRFQYPNGYKLRFPKLWPWRGQEPKRPEQAWSSYLYHNGVCIRPAVLVARLLLIGADRGVVHEISAADIRDRLFRITTEPRSDEELLARYLAPPETAYEPASPAIRNAQEWIRAMAATGLFEQSGGGREVCLRLIDSQRPSLLEVIRQVGAEPLWLPSSDEFTQELTWFSHSQAPEFLSEPAGVGGERANSIAAREVGAHISLRPHGRVRQLRRPVLAPAGYDSAAAQLRQRSAELVHEAIVEALATHLRSQGLQPLSDPNSVDLSVRQGGKVRIYEVKSIEGADWVSRLRLAVGQILEYQSRFLAQCGELPETTIVLSRPIDIPGHLKSHLDRLKIELIAFDGRHFKPV